MIHIAGRKRIKDKGIRWIEYYSEKSESVKKKFEKILPGSYFRWVGKDYEDGVMRYVVVGPSVSRREGKSFFAGNKKMPRDPRKKAYSPSGKYFPSLRSAIAHAIEMWGVRMPNNAGHYTRNDLATIEIPKHVKG
ncbi:hypothetical protein LCGC14_0630450 [marine sediment metagenome]|uniref:Uncharacterized protein n=1 Tax=marine sediment metagenome TaxID=412755 RepID=A0A0F9TNH6_9ZZZZ